VGSTERFGQEDHRIRQDFREICQQHGEWRRGRLGGRSNMESIVTYLVMIFGLKRSKE
jgi:alpha/beta superfamily hydrolase